VFNVDETTIVFIVDDDESVHRSLRRLIKSVKLKAESLASAEDFLKAGGEKRCSCLILDVRLPGMNGLQLQSKLNEMGFRIPIIFITAYEDKQVEVEAKRSGAIAFFRKPFNDQALLEAVSSAFQLAKSSAVGSDKVAN
jgi:two-component system, LuxR family, response regulator FixJ